VCIALFPPLPFLTRWFSAGQERYRAITAACVTLLPFLLCRGGVTSADSSGGLLNRTFQVLSRRCGRVVNVRRHETVILQQHQKMDRRAARARGPTHRRHTHRKQVGPHQAPGRPRRSGRSICRCVLNPFSDFSLSL